MSGTNIKLRKLLPISLILVIILILLVIFLFQASAPGRVVEGCPEGCAAVSEQRDGSLRVVSLNMLHGFPDFEHLSLRLDLIAGEIRRLDADIVLLQEVPRVRAPWTNETVNAAEYLAQDLGYNHLYYRANGNRNLIFFEEGEAILSRFPLKKPVFSDLEPSAGFFENRVVLGAATATPWGEVEFFVAHLAFKDSQLNLTQVESLRNFVTAKTQNLAVIAGDFNAKENSPQILELSNLWRDAYRDKNPSDDGFTCCIDNLDAQPGERLEKRIDYVFLVENAGRGARVVSAQRIFDQPFPSGSGWQWASDHAGVFVEVKVAASTR